MNSNIDNTNAASRYFSFNYSGSNSNKFKFDISGSNTVPTNKLRRYLSGLSFKTSKTTASAGTDTSSPRRKPRARRPGAFDAEQLGAEGEEIEERRRKQMKNRKSKPKHSRRNTLRTVSSRHRAGELEEAKMTTLQNHTMDFRNFDFGFESSQHGTLDFAARLGMPNPSQYSTTWNWLGNLSFTGSAKSISDSSQKIEPEWTTGSTVSPPASHSSSTHPNNVIGRPKGQISDAQNLDPGRRMAGEAVSVGLDHCQSLVLNAVGSALPDTLVSLGSNFVCCRHVQLRYGPWTTAARSTDRSAKGSV